MFTKKVLGAVFLSVSTLALTGCAGHHYHDSYANVESDNVVITVVGFGAPKTSYESLAQRRLMAMRASELDAYRKLAEQVSGVNIFGATSVDDYISGSDSLRLKFDTFLQGAAIQHQEFHDDGLVSTTMTLKVNKTQLRHMLEHDRAASRNGAGLINGAIY